MMSSREQAVSLLTAAKTHSDLAVKLSSLKQAKDIILSIDLSLSSELFPYLLDLQFSPEPLVRKLLLETIEEVGLKGLEHYSILIPVILTFIRDHDLEIANQSTVCGMRIYTAILEELALQQGSIEPWLEELWIWTLKFKDTVLSITYEPGSVGVKLLALKFLEMYVLLFTSDSGDAIKLVSEGGRRLFNISWVVGDHPILDPATLTADAYRILGILLDFLRSPISSHSGALTISIVNCLAAIARKRPIHYGTILSALLDFNPKFVAIKGIHTASIQYSLRTALLGFLRCTCQTIFESKERLLRALHAMNAGDAADQVIRQVDKIIRNEHASRDSRLKDDQSANQLPVSGDNMRKRPFPIDDEELTNDHDSHSKRVHHNPNNPSMPTQSDECEHSSDLVNGDSNIALLDSELTPAEQMIAMIGALLAEGERGAESFEILISNIHPDLLADIVVTNMKHLPKLPPLLSWHGNLPATHQIDSSSSPGYAVTQSTSAITISSVPPAQVPGSVSNASVSPVSDISHIGGVPTESKRDPRRDPRRLDPRRLATPLGASSVSTVDDNSIAQSEFDCSKPVSLPITMPVENQPVVEVLNCRSGDSSSESVLAPGNEVLTVKEEILNRNLDTVPDSLNFSQTLVHPKEEDAVELKFSDAETASGAEISSLMESDELPLDVSGPHIDEETNRELPQLPQYVELTENQQRSLRKLAVARIIESFKHLARPDLVQTRIDILARLVAQVDSDHDVVVMLQKHIVADYQEQKGHELVLHVLYHLHCLMILDSNENHSSTADVYEKFLLSVAKSLLDSFPASDKSFSRLLGEVPLLPDSTLKLLGDLCYSDVFDTHGKEVRDVERVTQGLGALWSLILGRPKNRQTCLDIVLKCAVHLQEGIRAKAIRLVANKLYELDCLADDIEQFALNMLLSAVDKHGFDKETSRPCSRDIRELEVGGQDTSICGSQVTEIGNSETNSMQYELQSAQNVSVISFPEAQRLVSLFFALCTKKPSLLQHVFDIYGRAPKTVKQAVHRLIPILIRTLGSSYSELLFIISDPPEGCENLLMLVLQVLTQDTSPSADLIAAVKHLYETKLKDATILIPILSSLSQNEVLPIFPRLVGLPIEKFQMALAYILQGSAYTGPALTPAEVLVAIHDISPEKDGLALKKITDACSACFEQRTVFTQQVFAKALNQMVNQMPLPLLFMRTVIQAIDAFPSLVDFVMEILSKLVSKQVWKMPMLWVGFLKCVSQTSPHSFPVLLKLPPPQLESALNKHANLRGPLAAHASQSSLKSSLSRSTLTILGLGNESQMQQLHASSLYSSDNSSSVCSAS